MQKPMATRHQYGDLNFSEGGAEDSFSGYEDALRAAADKFNVGSVYVRPTVRKGGVLPGDNGIMPTRNMWYGVIHANLSPVGLTAGQTYLFQTAGNPVGWAGDAPLDLQPGMVRAAPWRRNAPGSVRGVNE
jgi:hypothetical protein